MRETDHLKDLGVYASLILQRVLKK
jgi:hypothetical protein